MDLKQYKDTPGSHKGVTRRNLFPDAGGSFETRYFEVAPGGYTSFEQHGHEHCVVVVRGRGTVRLGEASQPVEVGDLVHVRPWEAHQFQNTGQEPFGILCVVDRDRDRPQLIDAEAASQASDR
ncbi:MAG: cupin domain-containing protein [Fimbriimonas ginsengisoli]|uniref:Cupin domain-containing protein n=1 Tax=Fimbriimonas ginsengisoli TaxID=1005039 RepID=A0A931LWA0_FIMGI|nr:cupin domain-containing protein [Fimbriimonas ginsengisoli]